MTNLFPLEALNKCKEQHKDNAEAIKAIKKIELAQKNYEIRDLLLSVWARKHPELVLERYTGELVYTDYNSSLGMVSIPSKKYERLIVYNNEVYSYKQSSPHKLVDLFIECYKISLDDDYVNPLHYINRGYDDFIDIYYDNGFGECIFYCSQEYTEETGIEPHICDYDECIKLYVDYINWKIKQKEK